jgi:hypothetical protein
LTSFYSLSITHDLVESDEEEEEEVAKPVEV